MTTIKLAICACMLSLMAMLSACSTGGMFQIGWLPVTAIDHHEMLSQEDVKQK